GRHRLARRERSMKDRYRRDGWEPLRDQLSPYSSDGAWNQPDRLRYQAQSGVWPLGSDAASGNQRGARRGGNTIKMVAVGVAVLAVLAAAWVVTHRADSLRSTPVTTTKTIPIINAIWAPPSPGAAPAMTAEQAWKKWGNGLPVPLGTTVQ